MTTLHWQDLGFPRDIADRAAASVAQGVDIAEALEGAILDDYADRGWPVPISANGEWITFDAGPTPDTPGAETEHSGENDVADQTGLPRERQPAETPRHEHEDIGPVHESDGGDVPADGGEPGAAGEASGEPRGDYRLFDRPMSGPEFKTAIAALGLSQKGAARFLGSHPVTVSNWTRNGAPILVARMLRYLLAAEVATDAFTGTIARYRQP